VRLPYLNYSTAELRRAACEAELTLNRRTAPSLYLAAPAIVRGADGRLSVGGDGAPVDWGVEMRRFPDDALLASRAAFDDALLLRLADAVAAFHDAAELAPEGGGADALARIVRVQEEALRAGGALELEPIARFRAEAEAALAKLAGLIERRRLEGRQRLCHGDLHLGNVALIDGKPTPFDCIEFDLGLARIDVLYDLAFLLMDFWRRGLRREANLVMNRWLLRSGDAAGLRLLPFFLRLRAAIRAQVAGFSGRGEEADALLACALDLLRPRRPLLVGVGGFSGSGKTRLARALAPELGPPPGAALFRSDELRKRQMGVEPEQPLGPEGYAADVGRRTYAEMRRLARASLEAGHAAICDAAHNWEWGRKATGRVAGLADVPFRGFWLEAPEDVLAARAEARTGDASDATARIVRRQVKAGAGEIAWTKLDASGPPEAVLTQAHAALVLPSPAPAGEGGDPRAARKG
jgi:aminoglycoside phosphotransferase family enzyme/predicted kinase